MGSGGVLGVFRVRGGCRGALRDRRGGGHPGRRAGGPHDQLRASAAASAAQWHRDRAQCARPALPLGLGGLSDESYVQATFPFAYGDRLLLYTDGVSETRDGQGTFYPLAERTAAWSDQAPGPLVQKITADLKAYAAGPLNDDMAMIVVQRDESPGGRSKPPGQQVAHHDRHHPGTAADGLVHSVGERGPAAGPGRPRAHPPHPAGAGNNRSEARKTAE